MNIPFFFWSKQPTDLFGLLQLSPLNHLNDLDPESELNGPVNVY